MKLPKHFQAGIYFIIFEGIFWAGGVTIFKYLSFTLQGWQHNYILKDLIISFFLVLISIIFFSLFVKTIIEEIKS